MQRTLEEMVYVHVYLTRHKLHRGRVENCTSMVGSCSEYYFADPSNVVFSFAVLSATSVYRNRLSHQ
jgi:hypothetical protein